MPCSRFPRAVVTLCCLSAGGATTAVRADYTAAERERHRQQIEQLERIVERHGREEGESREALLGMLILRDRDPEHTARCSSSLASASRREVLTHELACAHCRDIMILVRQGLSGAGITPITPTDRAVDWTDRARALIADEAGYVRPLEELGEEGVAAALDLLERALRDSPDHVEALQLYGVLGELQGDASTAERAFRKALNLSPSTTWGLNNIAIFYARHELVRHSYYILKLSMQRRRDFRTARLLARLRRTPQGAELVPESEAIRLMEWVIRGQEETSREKILRDRLYLEELRREAARGPEERV